MAGDILLGVVIGAQGLGGEVRVKLFTEHAERLGSYGPLHTPRGRTLDVLKVRALKAGLAVVRFAGVDDRDAAEALANEKLLVARSALPVATSDEFYHADLIGLRAEDAEGRLVGEIRAVHNFGAGDVIEFDRGEQGTLLLPFTQDFVPVIDLAAGRVIVAVPQDDEASAQRGVE